MSNYLPTRKPTAKTIPATATVLAAAASLLADWDRLQGILAATRTEVSALLAQHAAARSEVGSAAIDSEGVDQARTAFDRVVQRRGEVASTRAQALVRLTAQRPALEAVRTALDTARSTYAATAIEDFTTRYAAAMAVLQALQLEGDALSSALGASIPMPTPSESPSVSIRIDPVARRYGALLDRLDQALAFLSGLQSLQAMRPLLHEVRGFDPTATYRVIREFRCHLDGLSFVPGVLVDAALVGGAVILQRLPLTNRNIKRSCAFCPAEN